MHPLRSLSALGLCALLLPAPAARAATVSAELPAAVYRARQERVMKELDGCVGLLAAQGVADGEKYRPDGDFLWLTGVDEGDAWIVLSPKARYVKTSLFLRARDPERERWTGPRDPISPALKEKLGVDEVLRGRPEGRLVGAVQRSECVAIIAPVRDLKEDRPDAQLARQAAGAVGARVVHKRNLIANLRAAHDADELARLERAVAITRAGHEAAARSTVAGARESDVQREIEYAFLQAGATGFAYPSIVGSGPNGAVLHWKDNTRQMKAGELVVVDAGAEFGRYACDITRTYPVSGTFDPEQAKAYRAVYQAQEDIMAAIKPGASMADLQKAAEDSLKKAGYLEYFIHGFGHYVGLDVHDPGPREDPMPVGAVLTVEPGIYIPEKGWGIRIEDEVLVTETGYRLLSRDFPRKLEEVEAWVARARSAAAAAKR